MLAGRLSTADYLRRIGVAQLPPRTSPFDPGYDPATLESHLDHSGHLCGMASEEVEDFIPIPDRFPTGHYCVLFDQLEFSTLLPRMMEAVGQAAAEHPRPPSADRWQRPDSCLPDSWPDMSHFGA